MTNRVIDHIVSKVIQMHHDDDTIKSSIDSIELDEAADNVGLMQCDGFRVREVGNALIALIAICERNGTSIETCLNAAYDEIRGTV